MTLSNYRPDIDGLRAIAVLSVVTFHLFPNMIKGGFIGVDIFFVISGFLISSILWHQLENNTFSFVGFYKKRMKRLFPALISIFIFCFIFGWFALFPSEYKQLAEHISAGAGFVSNFLLWHETGYFDNAAGTKPLLHLWSLAIEEQFYMLWPVLLWMIWKKQWNVLIVTACIIVLSFLFNLISIKASPSATFYAPWTRFWELLCGSCLAYFLKHPHAEWVRRENRQNIFAMLGLSILMICVLAFSKKLAFPGIWALLPVMAAVLLIMAGQNAWINRSILAHPSLVWFGLISYPLYLWHWPLFSFASIMAGELPERNVRIVVFLLSILLAWLTYKLIEKPIRNGKDKSLKIVLLIGFMLIMAGLGFMIQAFKGFSSRSRALDAFHTQIQSGWLRPDKNEMFACDNARFPNLKKLNFTICSVSKAKEPAILFLGDSHAAHYQYTLWKQFPEKSILMLVETSCLPFATDAFMTEKCKQKYDAVLALLQSNKNIKTVYLSAYWAYLMSGGFDKEGMHWRHAKALTAKGTESFLNNGRLLLATALKAGKEVIFLKDIPDLNFNVNNCFQTRPLRLPFHPINTTCAMNFKAYQERIKKYDEVLQQLLALFPQVKVYDPRPLFCNQKRCIARDASFPYYFNGDHLNFYGANLVIKDMQDKLPSLRET